MPDREGYRPPGERSLRRWGPLLVALFFVRCGGDGEGPACWDDADCADGEACEGAVEPAGCSAGQPGQCTAPASCGGWDGVSCPAGTICNYGYSPPDCRPASPVGGPCGWHDDCAFSSAGAARICQGAGPGGVTGSCIEAGSVPTGGACDDWRACAAPDGCFGGVCRGPGGEGQGCVGPVGEGRLPCVEGLYCDSLDGVCRRFLAEGEHCFSRDDRCAEGLFCYSQEAACHAPLGEGETCIPGDVCATGLFCSSRASCSAPLALGEGCWGDDRCEDGLFCYSREAVCHAPLGEGEACQPGRDVCEAGLACERPDEVCRAP